MICPCKGCNDRHLACHADCKRYKQWRGKLQAIKKVKEKEKLKYNPNIERERRGLDDV